MVMLFITTTKKKHTEIATKSHEIIAMKNLAMLVSEECRKLWNFGPKRKLNAIRRA